MSALYFSRFPGRINQSIVNSSPWRKVSSGTNPVSARIFVLSHQRRETSDFLGRRRCTSAKTSTSLCIISRTSFNVSPMDISKLDLDIHRFSPMALLQRARASKPRHVSLTKVKSRVGLTSPKLICIFPFAIWVMIVGMTALADWRGPNSH